MTSAIATLRSNFSPLRYPNFRLYLGGQAVSLIGTWLQVTAQGWLVWTLTGSEAASGIVTMLSTLPILLLGPWAGVWADRLDRRKILIGTQAVAMMLAFILAYLVQTRIAQIWHVFPPWSQPYNETAWGVQASAVQIWHVYLLSIFLGIVNTLDLPTQQTFLGDLTGMGDVRKAVNLNVTVLQISRLIGPAFAGFIIARLGVAPAFWLNGLSFLAVIISLILVRSNQVRPVNPGKVNPLREVGEALKFLRTQPRMQDLFIFSTMVVFLFLSIILSQLPAVADRLLGGDANTYSTLQMASGAGALIGVTFVAPLAQARRRVGVVLGLFTIWMGVWLLLFGLSRVPILSIICMFMGSLGPPVVIPMSLGLTQQMSPPNMRARLISLFTMISFGLQTVAVLLVGVIAERLGISTAIQLNALLLIAGAIFMLARRTELRRWVMEAAHVKPAIVEGHV
ncbi:MAG: MFS transporter [Anaerolineae bacterium]